MTNLHFRPEKQSVYSVDRSWPNTFLTNQNNRGDELYSASVTYFVKRNLAQGLVLKVPYFWVKFYHIVALKIP